jgi:mRNA interferase RelE/StbE
MTHEIEYLPRVTREDIPALPKAMRERIQDVIDRKLVINPLRFGKPLRSSLSGYRSLRVGDWRVIYYLEIPTNIVVITAIDHRKDVYDV